MSTSGHVVIPRLGILKRILPLELFLLPIFKIHPKLITEGENCIKVCVKDMTGTDMRNLCTMRQII